MELKIKNGSIQTILEYLPKVQLKGRENRARQKLMKKVSDKFQEFFTDVQDIKVEYPDDTQKQNEELETLLKEEITLDMTEYAHLMPSLYEALLNYPHEISTEREQDSPSNASVHDHLVDILEEKVDSYRNTKSEEESFQEGE